VSLGYLYIFEHLLRELYLLASSYLSPPGLLAWGRGAGSRQYLLCELFDIIIIFETVERQIESYADLSLIWNLLSRGPPTELAKH
jgi:hypothetical protein